ncbi:MAG TPA: DUF554 domain-containing protein [Fimbriimonadaceae bacterium]|nr:DUF554 domain-containing protein [Fimbriimonadaceae bacterium]
MRGTLLNTATVVAGTAVGVVVGSGVPPVYQDFAIHGIALVAFGVGIKMVIGTKNPLIVVAAMSLGGIIGLALGLHHGVEEIAAWSQRQFGGHGRFAEGIVTSFVLFCVGPMTLLGCIEDGLEQKIDILSLKSTMDGISSFFLAAATGAGLFVTAVLLLIFQGVLTLAAKPLRPLAEHPSAMAEATSAGGALLMATAIGMLGIKDLYPTNYLPAIFLAPLFALGAERFAARRLAAKEPA